MSVYRKPAARRRFTCPRLAAGRGHAVGREWPIHRRESRPRDVIVDRKPVARGLAPEMGRDAYRKLAGRWVIAGR